MPCTGTNKDVRRRRAIRKGTAMARDMFQSFDSPSSPEQGPPRLAALRAELARQGLTGFIVPRADAHQGEYVAPHDERLAWLTGFTGSAGFCIVLPEVAGVFIDGRYRVQVKEQVAAGVFTPVHWPETRPADWLCETAHGEAVIGFDPWLHAVDEIARLEAGLAGSGITLKPVANPVDAIWDDQPAPPTAPITPYPLEFAGEPAADKAVRLGHAIAAQGARAAVLTLPDSIAWLLNIRGTDIARNPVPHCFAVLHAEGQVDLIAAPGKCDAALREHLGATVTLLDTADFGTRLDSLDGPVLLDRGSAPVWVRDRLQAAGASVILGEDPCKLPKACKNATEIAGTREAHLRDAAAMCRFLAWFEAAEQPALSEIDLVTALEGFRRDTNMLLEISFDTIAGAGPHGALPHYRVSEESNRQLAEGDLIVVDSGGQYLDGTTDITRTLVVGAAGAEEKACFTRVLKGMIAMSRARFPRGIAGQHLDALARYPLWLAGLDYDHGTGHGVGTYLCVHEGPQRLSRVSDVALREGMILSNEPGYYREGAFGIRIENLLVVRKGADLTGADDRDMLDFETITWVPIERRLIDLALLDAEERAWVDGYHRLCRDKLAPRVDAETALWLSAATAPLG